MNQRLGNTAPSVSHSSAVADSATIARELSNVHTLHVQYPIATSKEFREHVLRRYPALIHHKDAMAYRNLLQWALFSTFVDKDTGKVILPYDTVASLLDKTIKSRRYAAEKWLAAFSADVLPLNPLPYRYRRHEARTIDPEVDAAVLAHLHADRKRTDKVEKVWFLNGAPVSRRVLRAAVQAYEERLMERSKTIDVQHPAFPLIQYSLSESQRSLTKVLKANMPAVRQAINNLPTATEHQKATREWSERVLASLDGHYRIFYTGVAKTCRVYAMGATVHLLPRDLRKMAFGGQTELDLRACQLAVVARLWDIPELQTFLEAGQSIWTELLGYLGLPPEHKPIIKSTVYSIVFGMNKANLHLQLAKGTSTEEGVGEEATLRFFGHPLVRAVLRARSRQHRLVWEQSGCEDAFGRWLSTRWQDKPRQDEANSEKVRWLKNCPSVMAAAVQSYELRIMMSILPVLQIKKPEVHLLSWLHDGVTLHFSNQTKKHYQISRLQKAVQREAAALGMATQLEAEDLP